MMVFIASTLKQHIYCSSQIQWSIWCHCAMYQGWYFSRGEGQQIYVLKIKLSINIWPWTLFRIFLNCKSNHLVSYYKELAFSFITFFNFLHMILFSTKVYVVSNCYLEIRVSFRMFMIFICILYPFNI